MNPKKFTATTSWRKSMSSLPDKTRLEIYDALFDYVETGKTNNLTPEASAAFAFIKTDIDLEVDKSLAICDKRKKAVLARWNRAEETDNTNPQD